MPDFETLPIVIDPNASLSVTPVPTVTPGVVTTSRALTGEILPARPEYSDALRDEAILENASRMGLSSVAKLEVNAHGKDFKVAQALILCPEMGKVLLAVQESLEVVPAELRSTVLTTAVAKYAEKSQATKLALVSGGSGGENFTLPSNRPNPNPTTSAPAP